MKESKGENEFLWALCRIIKERREQLGISQGELASRANLHRTYISNIERGATNVTVDSLSRLARALGLSMAEVVTEAEDACAERTVPLNLLVVEDNLADLHLMKRALRAVKSKVILEFLKSGADVMPYLRRRGKFVNAKVPDLIILDLNLPKKSGHQILREIKSDEKLKQIPVVVLTTSSNAKDVSRTYAQSANSFITKPVDPQEFEDAIESTVTYWSKLVTLPPSA